MFKIAICEDNKDFSLELKTIIHKTFFQYNLDCLIDCYYTGEDILKEITINNKIYDVIFFDIELPNLNGIEAAKKIRKLDNNILFIFITHLNEKVYEVLNLNIFNFIRKNHFQEEIDPILKSLIKTLDCLVKKYTFPIDGENTYFKLYDILYLEVLNRQLIVHTEENSYVSSYRSLKNIPFKLEKNYFFEIYRGIVINLNHVKNFNSREVLLLDGTSLPIARRRFINFKNKFYKHIASRRDHHV